MLKETEREWLSMTQISRTYGVSRATLYKLRASGVLKPYSVSNSALIRYRRSDVEALFNPMEGK